MEPLDRRGFLALGGAGLICTIAGHQISADDGQVNVEKLAREVPVPPKVAAAEWRGDEPARRQLAAFATSSSAVREYWIAAEPMDWNIVPTHRDQMMAERVKEGKTKFKAYGYRPYSPGFKSPLAPARVPGPLLEAEVGDTVVVHFRNRTGAPVTMHPHGIFYANEMDGTYKGKWT
ncbi:MAG: multicopper oxidase domain-containing protein, partial [Actinobacteria bacterium]|nr:multicopper oxidase domain-containing protein [Actinomycetota bacterium]